MFPNLHKCRHLKYEIYGWSFKLIYKKCGKKILLELYVKSSVFNLDLKDFNVINNLFLKIAVDFNYPYIFIDLI